MSRQRVIPNTPTLRGPVPRIANSALGKRVSLPGDTALGIRPRFSQGGLFSTVRHPPAVMARNRHHGRPLPIASVGPVPGVGALHYTAPSQTGARNAVVYAPPTFQAFAGRPVLSALARPPVSPPSSHHPLAIQRRQLCVFCKRLIRYWLRRRLPHGVTNSMHACTQARRRCRAGIKDTKRRR